MRLTIVTETRSVGINEVFYDELDFSACGVPVDVWALQWYSDHGDIEFISDAQNQEITLLPEWATKCIEVWQQANYEENHPLPPTAEDNKINAVTLLQSTDWTTIPDVADPTKSNPYLANPQEFVVYRNAVRQYAIYPVGGNIDWPVLPQEVWTKVE